jgi:hypothetical protein
MVKTAGRILKSEDFMLEGQFRLDIAPRSPDLPKQTVAATSAPKLRMLENHPEYAVIEVTCSCGTKISVRCEYADAQVSAKNDPES